MIAITALGIASVFLLIPILLQAVTRKPLYRSFLTYVGGATALFALPVALCAAKLATGRSVVSNSPDGDFWVRALLAILGSEVVVVCIGALLVVSGKFPISKSVVAILLIIHLVFWFGVLRWQVWVSLFEPFVSGILLPIFVLAEFSWWVLAFETPSVSEAIRSDLSHRASSVGAFVIIGLAVTAWFPMSLRRKPISEDVEGIAVRLERGPCLGTCPSYHMTIHGGGLVEYVGERRVKLKGVQTKDISHEQVLQIVRALNRSHFLSLDDRAFTWCYDTPSVAVSVSFAGQTKSVVSDSGCTGGPSGVQADFVRNAAEIDKIVGSEAWVSCDGPCWNDK